MKKNNLNLNLLLDTLNNGGKKKALEMFEIEKKEWPIIMKDNGIKYNKKLKQYIISISKNFEELLEDIEKEFNNTHDIQEEVINTADVQEEVINTDDIQEEVINTTDTDDIEKSPIDICDYINKKDESKNIENKDKAENTDNNIQIDKDKKDILLTEEKSKRGRKKIELKEGYELYTQQLNKKLIKALEFKALSEGVNVETLVNDLLIQSIDKKYFIGISI